MHLFFTCTVLSISSGMLLQSSAVKVRYFDFVIWMKLYGHMILPKICHVFSVINLFCLMLYTLHSLFFIALVIAFLISILGYKFSEEWKGTGWWWWATSRVQAAVIVYFFGVSCGWWVFLRSYGAPDGKVGFSFMQFFMVLDSFSSLDPIVWIYWESISSFSHPFWENVGLYYSQGCCDLLLLEFHSRYLKYIIGCALLLLFFLLIYLFTILLIWISIAVRSTFCPFQEIAGLQFHISMINLRLNMFLGLQVGQHFPSP